LRKELQDAIAKSRAVALVWSQAASESRWVASEILTAFHLNRFIVPVVLDATEPPQFLSHSVFIDLHREGDSAFEKLGRQLESAPAMRNEFSAVVPYQSPELLETISQLGAKQHEIVEMEDAKAAIRRQKLLDPDMHAAEKRWRFDSTILNLAGYHRKNAYMFKHWDEYSAGRFPADPLLDAAERFFDNALFVNPLDYSALNGLGNVLSFEGELEAALFFVEKAITIAHDAKVEYNAAINDRQVIRRRMGIPPSGRSAHA
jgi:tetratricopeptide (TPR) repeat protein